MIKRLPIVFLAFVLLVAAFAGGRAITPSMVTAQGNDTPVPPALSAELPVISARLPGGSEVAGVLDSSCWPQPTPDTPECTFNAAAQPTQVITTTRDEQITFTLAPDTNPYTEFAAAISPDPLPAPNTPPLIIGLADTQGVLSGANFEATVTTFFVQVSAYFPAGEGREYFVIYNFRVQVEAGAATAETTAAATIEATVEATTVAGASTPTPPAPTQDTLPSTAGTPGGEAANVTVAPADLTATADANLGKTQSAALTAIAPTPAVTLTLAPPIDTSTPLPTDTSTPLPTDTNTPTATFTATATPTDTPTNTPTFTNTPTATFTPSDTLTPTPTSTNTPIAPELSLRVGGRDFFPLRTISTFIDAQGDEVTVNRANRGGTFRVVAAPGEAAQIFFPGPRPSSISVTLLTGDGLRELERVTLSGDNLLLYVLPSTPGSYVLTVEVQFGDRRAVYFFRVTVGN